MARRRARSFQQRLGPVWPENVTGDRHSRERWKERERKKGAGQREEKKRHSHRGEIETQKSETEERKGDTKRREDGNMRESEAMKVSEDD